MTYLKFENMKDYTEKELRNKCSSPWLVCVFAVIFVILTSLLIYVAWTPRTTVENIEIQIADYPEYSNLNQDQNKNQENYVDLDSSSSESDLKSTEESKLISPENSTALIVKEDTIQDKNGESSQIGDTYPTEKNQDDEFIIFIFEDPENDYENSEKSSSGSSADQNSNLGQISEQNSDFDFKNFFNQGPDFEDMLNEMSKFGHKVVSDTPWSIIKKSWYLETKIENNPDKNKDDAYFGQTDKKIPSIDDILNADKIFPVLNELDSQTTTDEDDYVNDPDLVIYYSESDSKDQDSPLDDLKINSPFKDLLDIIMHKFLKNGTSGQNDADLPDDLKDLQENGPNLLQNPFLTKFFRDQFPKQFSKDQPANSEMGQNDRQNDPNLLQNPFLSKFLTDIFPKPDQKDQILRYEVDTKASDDVDDQNSDFGGPFLHIFHLLGPKNYNSIDETLNDISDEDLTPVKNKQDGRTETADYPEETDEDETKEIVMSEDDIMSKFGIMAKYGMSNDKMSNEKMSIDKMSNDKMSKDDAGDEVLSKGDKPSDKISKSDKNDDDSDDLILSNPGAKSGFNKITEPDENFNTYINKVENKDASTKSHKNEGLKAKDKQNSQKIPVMDVEEN